MAGSRRVPAGAVTRRLDACARSGRAAAPPAPVTASPVRYAPSLPIHVFRDRRPSTPLYESEGSAQI